MNLLINELLAGIVMLTEDILDELQGLPEPSAYAHHETWRVWQGKENAVLNLRPSTNRGLPIHDFDWAGKLGSARYPAIMNPKIGSAMSSVRMMMRLC